MSGILTTPDGTPASRLAFGTMQFGGRAGEDDAAKMVDACIEAGINHFDTAHVYNDGAAERITGALLRRHRDRVIIATKAGYEGGAGRDNILRQFDESRRRLGMDMVDVLYLHRFDPDTELAETLETFATLRDRGQIRYVGLSNFAAWQAMKAQRVAARFDLRIAVLQPMYNLVKRQAEVEILPMCADQSIAVAPYSPLGGGLLTGKYARGGVGRLSEDSRYADRYAPGWMHDAARALADIAAGLGTDPATLAVAWVAAHPARPLPIISARTAAQLAPSLAALDFEMGPALRARLSALGPAPPPATDRLEEA